VYAAGAAQGFARIVATAAATVCDRIDRAVPRKTASHQPGAERRRQRAASSSARCRDQQHTGRHRCRTFDAAHVSLHCDLCSRGPSAASGRRSGMTALLRTGRRQHPYRSHGEARRRAHVGRGRARRLSWLRAARASWRRTRRAGARRTPRRASGRARRHRRRRRAAEGACHLHLVPDMIGKLHARRARHQLEFPAHRR
jgi:hypothetical protein